MPIKSKSKNKIALIVASWHSDIVNVCKDSCMAELKAQKFNVSQVDLFVVPGSLEIPLTAQHLAETGKYGAILAMGFIVDGGIYRHDFVAGAVIDGIMQVGLKTGVPVLSAVLTPQNFHEHDVHQKFFKEHMKIKGKELAISCLKTLKVLSSIKKN